MTKVIAYRKALEMRKLGKSYSQIKKELTLSKSTLSRWLQKYPLNKEQIDALRGKNPIRIERYRETMRKKRESRLHAYYEEEKKKWLPLTNRELFLAGLFLYWGEGSTASPHSISLNNTDPLVVKFALVWMTKVLGIPKTRIRVFLHLYSDMDANKEMA